MPDDNDDNKSEAGEAYADGLVIKTSPLTRV